MTRIETFVYDHAQVQAATRVMTLKAKQLGASDLDLLHAERHAELRIDMPGTPLHVSLEWYR